MPTTAVDPEVAACTARHATAPVDHCTDCGICEDCDVTIGQNDEASALCEVCYGTDQDAREERNALWYYTRTA